MAAIRLATVTILGLLVLTPGQAAAQVFGTFSWQMRPYCNVVSLTLVNTPAGFTLQGTDDQCGAVDKAGAFGIASFNTSGNVTANFSIVLAPGGSPVHVSAIISPATGSGTWTDSAGNSGTFALSGATPGLPARPLPPSGLAVASVTAREIAPDAVTGLGVQNGSLTSVDFADAPRATSVEGTQNITLTVGVQTNVRQIVLTAPAAGRVIVNASATVTANATGNDLVECSLTTGTIVQTTFKTTVGESAALPPGLNFPLGMTRGFVVNPGPFTVRLVCRSIGGVIGLLDTSMTAAYFPH
ncbi:MAG: hypothetical protein KA371_18365 [Acidobacteria bacterium]|nr:hypothetical protein [Acidobacteriota bacterium]